GRSAPCSTTASATRLIALASGTNSPMAAKSGWRVATTAWCLPMMPHPMITIRVGPGVVIEESLLGLVSLKVDSVSVCEGGEGPGGAAEGARPGVAAEPAGHGQVRLERGEPGEPVIAKSGHGLGQFTVPLAGRDPPAVGGAGVLHLQVGDVRPEQLEAVGVGPDAALDEVRVVPGDLERGRVHRGDQVVHPGRDVTVDALLVLVQQHQTGLLGPLRQCA